MSPVRSWVYVLCLDPPRGIGEGDVAPDAVISHYVGWTQQDWLATTARIGPTMTA